MKKILSGFLLSTLLLAACGGGDTESSDSSAEQLDPEKLYMGKCSSCHGGNLEGSSAPPLANIGSQKSYEEILDVIENGQGRMPGGMLKGERAEAVAQWLSEHE
ncbi:c-type cytochrome [Jeotgalibacillus proteolyticus]|uniref:Cytochrome C551 n=1 Tax=Jeotgalibacillus proteolyticus TaxID=2082395 RepID=A0A2S5GB48_9BACL|nr:cytochrome c [Jeotgalibacillus proteolyticus]PPA70219.1 cytochrome C551 [Jeotgalibacillus proteolyticus]